MEAASSGRRALSEKESRYWALVGLLGAYALVLSYAEACIPIPIPIPGVKLGLANAIVLTALVALDLRCACCIALIKVLASGFLFGSPVLIVFSLAGTLLATLVMGALVKVPRLSVILIAMCGAIAHNIAQLAVASLMFESLFVWASAPILLISGCVAGFATGIIARRLAASVRSKVVDRV